MWPSLKTTQELGAFGMLLRGHQTSGLRRAVVSPWLQALNPRHCRRSTRDKWYSLHGSRLGGPHLCKMWGEISSGILLSIEKNTRIHKRCSSATHLLTSFWFSRCRHLALKEGPWVNASKYLGPCDVADCSKKSKKAADSADHPPEIAHFLSTRNGDLSTSPARFVETQMCMMCLEHLETFRNNPTHS